MTRGIVQLSTVHRTRDNRIHNKECRALIEAGHDVTLVIRGDHDEVSPVPICSLSAPRSRMERLTVMQWEAWRSLGRLRPAVLHIHDPELIPMGLIWARSHGARVIFDAHEDLVKQIETKPYLRGLRRLAARGYAKVLTRIADRYYDGVVAATEDIAAGFAKQSAVVVFNYPWLSDYMTDCEPVAGRIVYAGDLTEERKLSFMVDVIERVRETVPQAHLVLAGAIGPKLDSVAERFDGDAVRHLGLLKPTEVPALLSSAEIGLIFLEPLPNYVNSLPTKLFEYQAAGLPVVASKFARWVEAFGPDGATAFVDSGDVDASAKVIVALLQDPDRRAQMSSAGRRAVAERYNFESQAKSLTTLIERLAKSAQ